MMTTKLVSPDIECEGCANAIKKAIGTFPGITVVSVDIEKKGISIDHEQSTSIPEIIKALDKAGFSTNN